MEKPASSNPATIGELIRFAEEELKSVSSSPKLDGEVLLMHLAALPRWRLLTERQTVLPETITRRFYQLVARRKKHEPVAYLTGEREFWGLTFEVSPSVLIPRPESELLVSEALRVVEGRSGKVRIADLGTGSGCLAVSIATELRTRDIDFECIAVDISFEALSVAQANAARHSVQDQVRFVKGSWFDFERAHDDLFDVVVANPPYVSRDEEVSPETRFEPSGALFAAEDGLAEVKRIVRDATSHLLPNGVVLVEVGAGKRTHLRPWLETLLSTWSWALLGDESEHDRFTVLRLDHLSKR